MKIFQQFQKSFVKPVQLPDLETKVQTTQDQSYEESSSPPIQHNILIQDWQKKKHHNEMHKTQIFKAVSNHQPGMDSHTQQRHIIDNEVLKSLFDVEMCVTCKYQRILYRDFINQLQQMDIAQLPQISNKMDSMVRKTVEDYLERKNELGDSKDLQAHLGNYIE